MLASSFDAAAVTAFLDRLLHHAHVHDPKRRELETLFAANRRLFKRTSCASSSIHGEPRVKDDSRNFHVGPPSGLRLGGCSFVADGTECPGPATESLHPKIPPLEPIAASMRPTGGRETMTKPSAEQLTLQALGAYLRRVTYVSKNSIASATGTIILPTGSSSDVTRTKTRNRVPSGVSRSPNCAGTLLHLFVCNFV